jgi:hypothetical protein
MLLVGVRLLAPPLPPRRTKCVRPAGERREPVGCESASSFDPSPFMVQVFGKVSEFAVIVESNRHPSVTPPFSSKQVAGQGLALMPLGVTVRGRFTADLF